MNRLVTLGMGTKQNMITLGFAGALSKIWVKVIRLFARFRRTVELETKFS